MMKHIGLFVFLLTGIIFLNQCSKSPGKSTLAVIDGNTITVQDMLDHYPVERLATSSDEDIKQKVDDLVQHQLFIADALAKGYPEKEDIKKRLNNMEDQRLFSYVYERAIVDSLIGEAYLKQMYENAKYEIHARHILIQYAGLPRSKATRSEQEALAVCAHILQQLKEGAKFEDLANQYTEDPSGKNNGGDLGWFGWGKMIGPFQDTAFKMKAGEVSDIVKTRFGLHIIKLEGRREVEQRPFEKEKENLRRMAMREKTKDMRELANHFISDIKADNNYQPNVKNIDTFFKIWNGSTHKVGTLDFVLKKINFTLPFFSINGQPYNKDWIINEVEKLGPSQRPSVQSRNDFGTLLDNMVIHYLIIEYGHKHHYDQEQKFKDDLVAVRDRILYNSFVRDEINKKLVANDEELQKYYDDHKADRYSDKEKVVVREVYVKDKSLADKVYKQIKAGQDIGLLARKYSERKSAKERDGELPPFAAGRYGEMGKKAFQLKPGEISEPIQLGTGWSIIQLKHKTAAGPIAYEKVKARVRTDINRELREKQTTATYQTLLAKYGVTVNYDAAIDTYHAKTPKKTQANS